MAPKEFFIGSVGFPGKGTRIRKAAPQRLYFILFACSSNTLFQLSEFTTGSVFIITGPGSYKLVVFAVAIASIGKRTQSSAAFEPQHTPQPKLTGTTIKPGASANAASLPDFTGMRISKLCDLKNNYSRVLKKLSRKWLRDIFVGARKIVLASPGVAVPKPHA